MASALAHGTIVVQAMASADWALSVAMGLTCFFAVATAPVKRARHGFGFGAR